MIETTDESCDMVAPASRLRTVVLRRLTVAAVAAGVGFAVLGPADESSESSPPRLAAHVQSAGMSGQAADFQAGEQKQGTIVLASATDSRAPDSDGAESRPAVEPESETLIQRMAGLWEDDYQGHRTLTLREDGTGVMVVELSGIAARLYAPKLTFQQTWSVDGEILTMQATGGEPAGKVNLVLKVFGRESRQRILEVTPEILKTVDLADDTEFEWRRVSENASP